MPLHYRHKIKKQPAFANDLVPGKSHAGIDGKDGRTGKNGPSIYFSDYIPNDDRIKDAMLTRIRQNMTLSMNGSDILEGIEYTPGDIIVSKDKRAYKLIQNNGKLDLKYLGTFHNPYADSAVSTIEYEKEELTNAIRFVNLAGIDTIVTNLKVPSTRSVDSSVNLRAVSRRKRQTDSSYWTDGDTIDGDIDVKTPMNQALGFMFGFEFTPILHVTDSSINLQEYDFFLKVHIHNEKSSQGEDYTLNNPDTWNFDNISNPEPVNNQCYNIFRFDKYNEMKLAVIGENDDFDYNWGTMKLNNRRFVYDQWMDKLHPSGNNLASNFIHCEYKVENGDDEISIGGITATDLNYRLMSALGNTNSDNQYLFNLNTFITGSYTNPKEYANNPNSPTARLGFTCGMLQFSKRKAIMENPRREYVLNYRSGDSAYYSGMTREMIEEEDFSSLPMTDREKREITILTDISKSEQEPFSNYFNNIDLYNIQFNDIIHGQIVPYDLDIFAREKDAVGNVMINDFLSSNNTFELICVHRKTGRTYRILNPEIRINQYRS